MFGYELSEFIGMNLLNLAMPESRELIRNRLGEGDLGAYEAAREKKGWHRLRGGDQQQTDATRAAWREYCHPRHHRTKAGRGRHCRGEGTPAVTPAALGTAHTTDTRGAIVIMNRVAEELTGWTQGEASAVGNRLHHCQRMTREPCEIVAEVLATGAITELANYALLTSRDGSERVIADSGAPIPTGMARPVPCSCFAI